MKINARRAAVSYPPLNNHLTKSEAEQEARAKAVGARPLVVRGRVGDGRILYDKYMALLQKREEQQTELQSKVAAQVQKRLRETEGGGKSINDHESTMLENQHQTRKAGMIIAVLLVLLAVAVAAYVIRLSSAQ